MSDAAPKTLLVGTALSVAQLHHTLTIADPAPAVVGCLLPDSALNTASDAATIPCPVLGAIDDLESVLQAKARGWRGREPSTGVSAEDAPQHAAPIDLVLVSLPLAMAEPTRQVAGVLDRLGVTWRYMPTLNDQLTGRTTSRLTGALPTRPSNTENETHTTSHGTAPPLFGADAPIDPAALLNRRPHALDNETIRACVEGKTVLITGAGGSIGSELARIVSRFKPGKLVLVERGENALFEIDREIGRVFPDLPRRAVMHDVTHRAGTMQLLDEHKPAVVFHAAAHKHVPMMEDHPAHAVENNFYGTRAIADAADACGAERFVMISTDKAVNPSSVMGATKRLAELYVQDLSARSGTVFAAVRFGNVLGSACSVLPIWADQVAHGGPVTVTHPDMTRYFMTIPEAAGLVLQAAALSIADRQLPSPEEGGGVASIDNRQSPIGDASVFLLDMGEPVRIVDLARRFVRAQGLEPDVDVRIAFTGVRPGEKLFESLAYDTEDMAPTAHEAIHIWRTARPDAAQMQRIVTTFDRLRYKADDPAHPWRDVPRNTIVSALHAAIPEMVTAAAG